MIKNKTVLVTGASSGIGQAIAIECAKNEAVVLIGYRDNLAGAKETLEQVNKYSKGDIFQADLSKNDDVEKLFGEINKKGYIVLDSLVNNAGEYADGKFDDLGVWEEQFKNIFMSQVYVSNAFIKQGKSKNIRKIVNISSVYGIGEMGNPDAPHYSAAKAAVSSFTMNLAKKYGPDIAVNAIAPGYVWTPPWESTSKEELKACEELTKIRRFIKPEEIATMVVEVLNNDAITGEVIRVDGGLHLLNLV
ncbi:MAG: 3-oxoacyl-(Acyl-carrier-protein) reductase [Candidatus Curtissbacteria bacterium GW2011_GWA1_40_16]|uniref:3-oxoacyl-(Acyl-carrier-protein) reductase n=1 Tax=Candidatus Curtissbacteria bacterium GW2011_GWA1_40_16 TaxID=1618405 RepID=A0A0G0RNA7_9BACT|nr:MAG: 3-oxoacyl-(Acyl-carrier-protein) reductase [Candidatus Curtissbacteria bacterium GW2011_GWA1_40_16]